MKLSGHEINSQLRQKLEMPTGRHLYVVLGTYERWSGTSEWPFREARSPGGQAAWRPAINVNHTLLDRIQRRRTQAACPDRGQPHGKRQGRLAKELDALVADKLEWRLLLGAQEPGTPVRLRPGIELPPHPGGNQKHILAAACRARESADRITLFHEAPQNNHRTLPTNLVPRITCGS